MQNTGTPHLEVLTQPLDALCLDDLRALRVSVPHKLLIQLACSSLWSVRACSSELDCVQGSGQGMCSLPGCAGLSALER